MMRGSTTGSLSPKCGARLPVRSRELERAAPNADSALVVDLFLDPGDGGTATVPIRIVTRGEHVLSAEYLRNAQLKPS